MNHLLQNNPLFFRIDFLFQQMSYWLTVIITCESYAAKKCQNRSQNTLELNFGLNCISQRFALVFQTSPHQSTVIPPIMHVIMSFCILGNNLILWWCQQKLPLNLEFWNKLHDSLRIYRTAEITACHRAVMVESLDRVASFYCFLTGKIYEWNKFYGPKLKIKS